MLEDLRIPTGRQCSHPQIREQPYGKQGDQCVAEDKGNHQHEDSQYPHPAIDQAAVAFELALRLGKTCGIPTLHRQTCRTAGFDAAQNLTPQAIEMEPAQRRTDPTPAPIAIRNTEGLPGQLIPALQTHCVT